MADHRVNSIIPCAAVILIELGVYDQRKLFGVTSLDVDRVEKVYAAKAKVNVADVNVPMVGGHGAFTGLPLFSQATPKVKLSVSEITDLTKRSREYGLTRRSLFADACLKGLNGIPDVVEYAYVQSTLTELPFLASKVKLGTNGVEEVFGIGALSDFEEEQLDDIILPTLDFCIREGVMEAYRCLRQNPGVLVKYYFPTYKRPW